MKSTPNCVFWLSYFVKSLLGARNFFVIITQPFYKFSKMFVTTNPRRQPTIRLSLECLFVCYKQSLKGLYDPPTHQPIHTNFWLPKCNSSIWTHFLKCSTSNFIILLQIGFIKLFKLWLILFANYWNNTILELLF